ncbi:MAG: Exo-beta-D-glucosaminidase precursor [Chloroflexi bacterium ADurb.Bin325]|nr:MAG: Exo-beta-D-glucosaminidase precursor [Chloroflexi bacterium ADurb.Bin325]
MTRHIDLSALTWRMGPAPRQPFTARPADDRRAVRAWHPARVPGAVRADLAAAGLAPRPETPEDIAAGDWADAVDWWYEAQLLAGRRSDEQVVLEADGIDDRCAVWLDDRLLAVHAGMFARQALPLSPWIDAAGPHTLAIRIWGTGALPRLPNPPWRRLVRGALRLTGVGTEYFPDRMATPHAPFSFGWDFAPRIFGSGVWDDIRLVVCRGAYIADLRATPEPLTADDPAPVRWRVRLAWRQFTGTPVAVELEVAQGDVTHKVRCDVTTEDVSPAELTFETPPLRRWWPWDQGEPHLCRVTVRLLGAAGPLDEASLTTGVCTVRREALADGTPWRFVINGRPVFLRGANWTPADILPGTVTPADYARLLVMARDAGVNFLRVWGGGVRERAAFWETCDRLGLMAWQEFPLACAFLDHHPRTAAYLAALADEARGAIRSLRHHPSLIAWCGGNEINPRRERLPLAALAEALAQEDGRRPWIPASPSDGDVHQWNVWHGFAPWTELSEQAPPFMSEFGLQALPDAATVAEMFPAGAPQSLFAAAWRARKAQPDKLRHYAGPEMTASLANAIRLTQRVQAAALQAGIEACRIRREGGDPTERPCGGVAFWQFNEPWRAVSWSVVDRAGRPKAAYAAVTRSYRPLLIAAQFPRREYRAGDIFEAELWLVNDLPPSKPGFPAEDGALTAEAWLDDRRVWAADTARPGTGAYRLGAMRAALAARPEALTLRLLHRGAVVAENRYDLQVPLPGPQPLANRLLRWLADRLLAA